MFLADRWLALWDLAIRGEAALAEGGETGGSMNVSELLGAAELYGWIGLGVALVFLTVGIGRVDASARGAYAARVLLLPSVALLWPIVLIRWAMIEIAMLAAGGDRS